MSKAFPKKLFVVQDTSDDGETIYLADDYLETAAEVGASKKVAVYRLESVGTVTAAAKFEED